uniref:Uncharacterized protein n=1 Tax=Anguilla anguilla TaxID=7936 RepID=A0A0E9TXT5_ANGAN
MQNTQMELSFPHVYAIAWLQ